MHILTYNVNGIRSALSKGLLTWLRTQKADVVCLQEIKATPDQLDLELFRIEGWHCHWHPAEKKGYSGVAILSRTAPDHVEIGMGLDVYDREGRVIRADFGDVSVMSVYMPSGSSGEERQAFKMQWLADFGTYLHQLRWAYPKLVVCGDYNICHQAIDIHDPVRNANSSGFLPDERAWMENLLGNGWTDAFRHIHADKPHNYTWWSYRAGARNNNKGWRIDYCLVADELRGSITGAHIAPNALHSDHCPTGVHLFR